MNHFKVSNSDRSLRITDPSYKKFEGANHFDMFTVLERCKPGTWWVWVDEKDGAFYAHHESTDGIAPVWGDERRLNNDYGGVGIFPNKSYPKKGFGDDKAMLRDLEEYESFPHGRGWIASMGTGVFKIFNWVRAGEVVAVKIERAESKPENKREMSLQLYHFSFKFRPDHESKKTLPKTAARTKMVKGKEGRRRMEDMFNADKQARFYHVDKNGNGIIIIHLDGNTKVGGLGYYCKDDCFVDFSISAGCAVDDTAVKLHRDYLQKSGDKKLVAVSKKIVDLYDCMGFKSYKVSRAM